MTVAELLSRISSWELSEWMAYEDATGPLDNRWRDDMLARIHECIQVAFAGGEPQMLPRPHQIADLVEAQLAESAEDEAQEQQDVVAALNEALMNR